MAKHKAQLEEKYKDVLRYELIQKDGVVNIPSIFMFTGGQTEYYPFLKACDDFNCTVHLQNERITIKPGDDDLRRTLKEMLYFQMAACPEMVAQYLRFLLHQDKMTWEAVKGQHEAIFGGLIMETLSKICAIIAGTLMFITPILLLVWLVRLIVRKSAKALGIACLICLACFVLSVIVGAFSSPTAVDGAKFVKENKAQKASGATEVVETQKTYEKEVKSFSAKRKISLELAQSIKDAMEQPGCPFSFEEINGWEQADDWASGERYQAWHYDVHEDKYYYVLIYTQNDAVVSIYDTTDGRKLIYECDGGNQSVLTSDDDSIYLVDGVIGEYGKEVKISNQSYIWYSIPCGSYEVDSNVPYSTVFVVSDEDSNDVRYTIQFQSAGETGEIVVEEGTHIELSMNSEVILTAGGE